MQSIIVGGGVGGCALAAAAARFQAPSSGAHSRVIVERRTAGSAAGMGFILMPNGLDALRIIAPDRDWASIGRVIDGASLRAANGDTLAEHALEPSVCVAREPFLQALRDEALRHKTTSIREGVGFHAIESDTRGIAHAVLLEDGNRMEGDIFFGADGANSRVRRALFPNAELSDAAIHEIVSIAEAPELARELGTTFRKYHHPCGGLAVGMLAESARRVVWFIQFDASRYCITDTSASSLAAFADATLDGWAADVLEVIASTNFAKSHLWKTRDLPPLAALHRGNAALLGDAAHACLPFTSQGANSALVDAVLLGRLLRDVRTAGGAPGAFAEYTRLRRPNHRRLFMEGRRLRSAFLARVASTGPVLPLVS